jgi:hypothetical protein
MREQRPSQWGSIFFLACVMGFAAPKPALTQEAGKQTGYLSMQRWLFDADTLANESITYEICGWGTIDLRTPLLSAFMERGFSALSWDDLMKRYDDSILERRRLEAMLTAHGANMPERRAMGLHATGGCVEGTRERIKHRATGFQAIGSTSPAAEE